MFMLTRGMLNVANLSNHRAIRKFIFSGKGMQKLMREDEKGVNSE